MAGRKRKCQICGEWIEDNTKSTPYKNGYAHTECFNVYLKVTTVEKKENLQKKVGKPKTKPQKELKDGMSEEEYQEKKKLCDYIRSLTHEDLPVQTYQLMKNYKKEYKISYKEMHDDLVWYFEIQNHSVDGDVVIGIVPHCHSEAQRYYSNIERSQNSCQSHLNELPSMYKEKKIVSSFDKKVKKPQIDMTIFGQE